MLLEPIHHYKNLHFAMEFSNVAREAPHYHVETEMALVLRGKVNYKIHHQEFRLTAGDVIVVDTQDLHGITASSEDVIMLLLYIDMEAFTDVYPNIDFMIFACDEFILDPDERQQRLLNKVAFLAHHMAEMMVLYTDKNSNDDALREKLNEILYLMVNQFQSFFIENHQFRSGHDDVNPVDMDRLYRIIRYMYENAEKKITLQDIAQREHLSIYYASHLIKKLSGLSFQNLLNYIRVENAEKLLNEDRYTLTQISGFCGFSSLSYFNKCFRIWHGITPAQYKKRPRHTARVFHKPFDYGKALLLLEPYLNTKLPAAPENRYSARHLFLSVEQNCPSGSLLAEVFPLHVRLAEAGMLNQHRDVVLPLQPESISAGPVKHFWSGKTAADAFAYVLAHRGEPLNLMGDMPALLTAAGAPTPFYSLYHAFSFARAAGSVVCELGQQYALVRQEDWFTLIMANDQDDSDLHIDLQFAETGRPAYLIRKSYDQNQQIAALAESLTTLSPLLTSCMFHMAGGSTRMLAGADAPSGSPHLPVELTIAPGELTVLLFGREED